MLFSVGIIELAVIGVLLIITAILAVFGHSGWRWGMVGVCCATAGALLSPADPYSIFIYGSVFFLFFLGGTRFGRSRPIAVV